MVVSATGQKNVPERCRVNYGDYQVAPGLVDTHIHGFAGYDVMDNSEESLRGMSQALSAGDLRQPLTAPFEGLKAICKQLLRLVRKLVPKSRALL